MTSTPEGARDRSKGSGPAVPARVPRWTVAAPDAGQRLDKFLAHPDRAGSRSRAADALARGRVFVAGVEMTATDAARPVATGEVVRLWTDRPGSAARPAAGQTRGVDTVYEDDVLVVVNKPAGQLTVPLDGAPAAGSQRDDVPSVLEQLQHRFRSHGGREPLVVHRIDRDTSGVVLFALTEPARARLAQQFARRTPERVYAAIVHGHPYPSAGTWHDRLVWDGDACRQRPARATDRDAVDALSDYRVVEAFEAASLLEVRLQTGRQGQIRVQAQLRGHPLLGDRRYGARRGTADPALDFDRQALHAERLAFAHPDDGRRVAVAAQMPADLRRLLASLRRR
jgi:23S rRNA pseudouridine1911/1915/1917 synthase